MKRRAPAEAKKPVDDDVEDEQEENPGADPQDKPSISGSDGDGSDSSGGSGTSGSTDGEDSDGSSAPEVSDEDEEDPDDEDGEAYDKIDVDFQFFDPKEIDFHGLKALLHTYLDGEQYDGSGLADTIIAQSTVGTVVKSGEDDDPIAVMTALNSRRYAGRPFMGQVRDYVLRKCGDEELRRRFQEAWAAEGTALLINERLINSPPQLAPPLVQALFDEIQWATEDEPTQELRDSFKLQRYLLVTRVYTDPAEQQQQEQQQDGSGAGPSSSKQRGKKKQKTASKPPGGIPLVIYVRPEDEFLHKRAAASFTWPIEGRAVPKDELRPMRLAMLVDARAAAEARRELDRVIGNAAGMAPPQLPAPAAGKGKRGGKQGGKK